MSHPVSWFHISGKDPKKLEAFYKKAFGWKIAAGAGDTGMVQPEKGGIPGGIGGSMDGTSTAHIYIETKDCAASLKDAEAAGGKTAFPPMELPDGMGTIAGFLDPEGIYIGLWAPGKAAKKSSAKKSAKKAGSAKKAAKPAKKAAKKAGKPAKKAGKKKKK